MPLYQVNHICPLTEEQRDKLALGITRIHHEHFGAPSIFVNVHFHDISETSTYVGGKPRKTNQIHATLRPGPSRTKEAYDELCQKLITLWDACMPKFMGALDGHPDHAVESLTALRTVFVVEGIVAGYESGFPLPEVGNEDEWMAKYNEDMVGRADRGDEEMVDLLAEWVLPKHKKKE